jgi:uncharacterized RDD family membrane protein YckC
MSDGTLATPAIQPAPPVRYATFTSRFRALVIDNLCIAALVLTLFFAGDAVSEIPGSTRVMWLLMVAVFLLYEPLLVSRRGATVGHAAAGIRVVDMRTGRWPSFGRSFARFLIKAILGVLSFFTMELSRRHQAVHDMLTHTTVQVAESAERVAFREERVDEPDTLMPSRVRRLLVIVLYLVGVLLVTSDVIARANTIACIRARSCDLTRELVTQGIAWGWLALSAVVVVAGWRGLLIGARRNRRLASDVAVA